MIATFRHSVAAATVALMTAGPAHAQSPAPLQLLDVPYVPQSVELCGGAAAAMVMRYWGDTGVYAESFAALVDEGAGGIRGQDLLAAFHARGWTAHAIVGDAALVQESLRRRHPPIALIEHRPGQFHYVVLIGWSEGRVVIHDPATAPFRVLRESAFLRAWDRSDRWTLLVSPDPSERRAAEAPAPAPADGIPEPVEMCAADVRNAVVLAGGGDLPAAQRSLEIATARCPGEAAPWRELAGVHALLKNWPAAAAGAREALRRDAADAHAARILATSLFVQGRSDEALAAWNVAGEPDVDLIEVRGLERTRFGVAADALGTAPGTRLTPGALRRAGRRLDEVPAFVGTRVAYTPRERGFAQITAAVVERPMLPTSPVALIAAAARAATDRELRLDVASPTGGGELWALGWRWWRSRPRLRAGIAAPSPFGGAWTFEVIEEEETFGAPGTEFRESRRRFATGVSGWATAALRWEGTLAVERLPAETLAGLLLAAEARAPGDRLALRTRGGGWTGARSTWTAEAEAEWRSRTAHERTVWLSRAGWAGAGTAAPLAWWPGAGTGQVRARLLRAHPLLDGGIVRGGVFGRRLVHAGLEWRRWFAPGIVRVGPAAFVDAARALNPPAFADDRSHVDAGVGVRIALPGAGVLRADLAVGLRDGRAGFSVGWMP